jgi:hypothetical protein
MIRGGGRFVEQAEQGRAVGGHLAEFLEGLHELGRQFLHVRVSLRRLPQTVVVEFRGAELLPPVAGDLRQRGLPLEGFDRGASPGTPRPGVFAVDSSKRARSCLCVVGVWLSLSSQAVWS